MIVIGSVMTSFVDFLISGAFLLVLMVWYRYLPPLAVFSLPFFVVMALAAAFGVGLWTAALMVEYRDLRFVVPFIVQFGLYISPVGFQSSVVPPRYRPLYALNPMVGIIDGFRWSLLGSKSGMYWPGLVIGVFSVTVLVVSGIWYFRKTEQTFADVI